MTGTPTNQPEVRVSDVAIDPATVDSENLKQAAAEIQAILEKYNVTLIPVAHIQLIPRPAEREDTHL